MNPDPPYPRDELPMLALLLVLLLCCDCDDDEPEEEGVEAGSAVGMFPVNDWTKCSEGGGLVRSRSRDWMGGADGVNVERSL